MFKLVSNMNAAFGNPKGDPRNLLPLPDVSSECETHYNGVAWGRVIKQCKNIRDEVDELDTALVLRDLDDVRDALCDIIVFALGAYHIMGIDADRDMETVVNAVMTRFVKDPDDLDATINLHWAKGVKNTYTQGEYPTMILKSSEDQPDAPKGKFLKSASYKQPIFYKIAFADELA